MRITTEALTTMVSRISRCTSEANVKVRCDELGSEWHFDYEEFRERLHIRNGSLVLSSSERNLPERDDFMTPEVDDMERYLIYHFCNIARSRRNLPLLLIVPIPVTNDKVASGFRIKGGPGLFELVNRFSGISCYASNVDLVEFSHYVSLTPEELYEACTAPNGKPPFFTQQASR